MSFPVMTFAVVSLIKLGQTATTLSPSKAPERAPGRGFRAPPEHLLGLASTLHRLFAGLDQLQHACYQQVLCLHTLLNTHACIAPTYTTTPSGQVPYILYAQANTKIAPK